MLRILFERAPVGVAYLDRSLRYVAVNEVMAAINGLPAADHVGRSAREVVPDLSARLERLVGDRVFRRGESVLDVTLVGETPAAPGRRREWRASFHPVGFPDGQGRAGGDPAAAVTGLCILAVEVSAEREAEAQRRSLQAVLAGERARLDAVIQQLSVGIAVVAVRSGRVVVRNEAAARITGLGRGPIGETLARLPTFRPDGTPVRWEERPVVRAMQSGISVLDEALVIERPDGERLRLRVSATPLRAGRSEAGGSEAGRSRTGSDGEDDDVVVVTFEDVTERHRNQLALELLARLGDVLSGLDELPEALAAAARACVGELADACTVHLRDDSGAVQLLAVAAPPDLPDLADSADPPDSANRADPPRPGPEVVVIETGETRHASDTIVTPIPGPAGPVGALGLAMVRPNRRFVPADVDVAKRLAERFAVGIAQRRAHERTRRLQALATALSEAASPAETRTTARRVGAEVTGASVAVFVGIDAAGVARALDGEAGAGPVPSEELVGLIGLGLGPGPDLGAAAGGDGGSSGGAFGAGPSGTTPRRLGPTDPFPPRYGVGPLRIGEVDAASWAVLPLPVGAGPRLLLAFGFDSPRTFPAEERELLAVVAEQVGVALERAERFEAERGGRRRAERIQALAEDLAVAERPEQVLAVLTGPARLLLGASAGLVVVTDPADPERLRAWRAPAPSPDARSGIGTDPTSEGAGGPGGGAVAGLVDELVDEWSTSWSTRPPCRRRRSPRCRPGCRR